VSDLNQAAQLAPEHARQPRMVIGNVLRIDEPGHSGGKQVMGLDLEQGERPMPSPYEAVSTYFCAKDGNRPFLMRRVFAEDVQLEMIVKTEAISFPNWANGLAAIEEILSRRFANDFENVYTFCLARPTEANRRHFPCHWLVGMSARNNGAIQVGSGRYDWYFSSDVHHATRASPPGDPLLQAQTSFLCSIQQTATRYGR